MKKSMIALLFAAISISAMADVLVYDYAASFKRVNVAPKYANVKYAGRTYRLDSAKVASDKFTGYMVIAACDACTDNEPYMENSGDDGDKNPGNYAVVYIARKGGVKGVVYRAIGRFYAGMFGAKTGWALPDGPLVNPTKFTDAYGFLSYALKGGAAEGGFMGKDHTGSNSFEWFDDYAADFDTVDHAGYGKVQILKQVTSYDCFDDDVKACYAIKNLSGNVLGAFVYTGHCSDFLFDVCLDDIDEPAYARTAPINGTFSLKLNNKLTYTKKAFNFATFEEAEIAILNKMGAKIVYGINDETEDFNDNMPADLEDVDAEYEEVEAGDDDDDDDDTPSDDDDDSSPEEV